MEECSRKRKNVYLSTNVIFLFYDIFCEDPVVKFVVLMVQDDGQKIY